MIALMTLRTFSSTESGMQLNHYGVSYHLITQVSLAIHSVQGVIVQLLYLQTTPWHHLIMFIPMLLGSM